MSAGKYRLYGRPNAGSLAPQIVLEEIGAPYELIWVGRSPAEVEDYRAINPTGKVPALVLPDGTAMFESAAILIHLCDMHPEANLAPPPASPLRPPFLQWMLFLSSSVYESALRWYYPERYCSSGAAGAGAVKEQAQSDYLRHLEFIHGELSPYVLGEQVSAADPYLHMLSTWYPDGLASLHSRMPKLARHAELLRNRTATRRAEQAHSDD